MDTQELYGRIIVFLTPIPKLRMQPWRVAGEIDRARPLESQVVYVVICAAKACSLNTLASFVTQTVRDNQKLPPIKRHLEFRSRTPAIHTNGDNS